MRLWGTTRSTRWTSPTATVTPDARINALAILEERVVVTKDSDFVDTFLLRRTPHKLLLIATGNASNKDLLRLFEDNLQMIVDALEAVDFIELDGESITWRQ